MQKGLASLAGIFSAGLAVGLVASQLFTYRPGIDAVTSIALLEVGLVLALILAGIGMVIGAWRGSLAASSARAGAPRGFGLFLSNHLTMSNVDGNLVFRMQNLGVYDSFVVSIPAQGVLRSAFWNPSGNVVMMVGAITSIALAALAQYSFRSLDTNGKDGVIIYAISMVIFVLVARAVEAGQVHRAHATMPVEAPTPKTRSGFRQFLIAVALIAMLAVLANPDLTRWDQDQRGSIVLWVIAIFAFAAAFLPWGSPRGRSLNRPRMLIERIFSFCRSHAVELSTVGVILALAFIARSYNLSLLPRAFGGDEGEMGSSALDVLRGRLINPFITGWLSHPTLFFFLQSYSMRLFGETVFGVRMLSVIAGTLTVLTSYVLIRQLFDRRVALITAVLLAVFSAHIHYSRLAVNNIEDGLIASIVLFLTYQGLVTRKAMYFSGAGLSLGLGLYFYQGARIVPVIVLLLLAFWLISDFNTIRMNLSNLLVMAAAAFVAAGPLLLFFYVQPGALTSRLVTVNVLTNGLLAGSAQSPGGGQCLFL